MKTPAENFNWKLRRKSHDSELETDNRLFSATITAAWNRERRKGYRLSNRPVASHRDGGAGRHSRVDRRDHRRVGLLPPSNPLVSALHLGRVVDRLRDLLERRRRRHRPDE